MPSALYSRCCDSGDKLFLEEQIDQKYRDDGNGSCRKQCTIICGILSVKHLKTNGKKLFIFVCNYQVWPQEILPCPKELEDRNTEDSVF